MVAGFVAVAILSGMPNDLAAMFGGQLYAQPDWLPVIEFPWRVMFGTLVTFAVAVCFRRRRSVAPGEQSRREDGDVRRRKIREKLLNPSGECR